MSSIDRFRAAAEGAKTNRDYVNTGSGSSSSSLKSLIESSYAELEATSDEVDRSTSDSSSSSSGTSWLEIATAAVTGISSLATAYATVKGTMGNKNGGAATGGGAAAGGDPLTSLQNATNTYSANPTKDNLKALASSITTATTARNSLKAEVDNKKANIDLLQEKIKDGKADYENCMDIADNLVDSITKNQITVAIANKNLAEKNEQIANIEAGKRANGVEIKKNAEKQTEANNVYNASQNKSTEISNQKDTVEGLNESERKKQDGYIADYNKAKGETTKLEGEVNSATQKVSNCSNTVNSIQTKINGLQAQIDAAKSQKQDYSGYESKLKQAKADLKQAKADLKEAEKAEKDAKKALEDNKNTIKDLEGKIKVGDQTLAQLKAEVETLTQQKATAEQQVQESFNALTGYIDETSVLEIMKQKITNSLSNVNDEKKVTEEQKQTLLKENNKLVKNSWNAEEAATTIGNQITALKEELGKENEANSLSGKLKAYDTAIARAESVRDNGGVDLTTTASLTEGSELHAEATRLGYSGSLEDVTAIKKNGENFVITKNGVEISVDKQGNNIVQPSQNEGVQ